jgi:uncharacterized protein (TIGR01777 family)
MKVLIAGASGLVGTALVSALSAEGHTVCRLIRPESTGPPVRTGFDVPWSPATGDLGSAAAGADAVVNLAGASIAGGRWTEARKQVLLASRVETTRALVGALAKMAVRPRALVSASGAGYYGWRGDEILTEESGPGQDFLARMAVEWEAEARKAEVLGLRVVLLRFGMILARRGGGLPKIMLPFRFGLGGRIASGKQWLPWSTLDDAVGMIAFSLGNENVSGPVNAVSPEPVQNAEFTRTLAVVMHRPAIFPVPAFVLRIALGEMADALALGSQRAVPRKLEQIGYRFQHPHLEAALRAVLGKA